ncbi:MAG: serine hydrolase [Acidobacteria bacterium]|nr:serine hydrolase [Acidobacteriota bacterium]
MLLLALLLAGCAFAAAPDISALDRVIEDTRKAWDVPGVAVAVVHNDEVTYLKGFGVRRLDSREAVTPDTRFAIGSTTKAFTTAAMGILVDEGKMAWDDPVRKHVPFFRLSDPLADGNVTMRDLVCHRTGLSRNDLLWYGSPWEREEIIRRIGLVALTRPFRSAYQYQNIMFLTAGYAVGRIAGATWEDFVKQRIFTPLGMTNSDFSTNEAVKAPDYSTPHEKREEKVQVIPWRNIDNVGPAGSINSSARDLTRWVRMQLHQGNFEGKTILKAATLRETHTPQMVVRLDDPASRDLNEGTNMAAYGLGWRIQDYRGHHMVSHGGAIDGFRAQITLLPNERYGVVVLGNLGGNNMPECLRSAIADQLLGLPAKDWNALYLGVSRKQDERQKAQREEREQKRHKDTKPSRELSAFAGAFENPAYGTASVTVENAKLSLHWSNWQTPLEHFHFDTFVSKARGPMSDSLVEFRLDGKGDVASVHFLDQEFRRRAP